MNKQVHPVAKLVVLALILLGGIPQAQAQVQIENAFPSLTFRFPVDIQAPPDGSDRLMVVGQEGLIWVFDNDAATPAKSVFLDIQGPVNFGGEEGLLGLAFDPDYATNGFFYVNYTASSPRRTVIARYSVTADPDVADPASELVLLEVDQPFSNHNAGQLQFGPDGYLYVGMGDGGSGGDPQDNGEDPTNLLGAMLRLDVHDGGNATDCGAGGAYTIPADNPLIDGPGGDCDEIWAYGLRNPWRYSFGPEGRLWVADVGQNAREEINWVEAGLNYGWDIMEGFICHEPMNNCNTTGLALPILDYPHDINTGGFSIIGGYVYTAGDCAELDGRYLYGDFVSQNVWSLAFDGGGVVENTLLFQGSGVALTSFGVDQAGRVYMAANGSAGTISTFNCPNTATLAITVTPIDPPVEIPPEGGTFVYNLLVQNNGTEAQQVDIWLTLDGPGAVDRTVGPISRTIGPGGAVNRNINQSIPGGAPAGTYIQSGLVGTFPVAEASDSFSFTKQAALAQGRLVQGWDNDFSAVNDAGLDAAMADPPATYALIGNYPNPFNPSTEIVYHLPEAAAVRLTVYDALGRVRARLVDAVQEAGRHQATWHADEALPSGLYFYRIEAGSFARTRSMLLLK